MQIEDSKLVKMLKSFDKSSHTRFGKYIKSPFFNNSKDLIILYDLLKKEIKEETIDSSLNKRINKKLKIKETDFKLIIKRFVYQLTKHVKTFLEYQVFETKDIDRSFYLLEALEKNSDLANEVEAQITELRKTIESEKNKDIIQHYYYKSLLNDSKHFLSDGKRLKRSGEYLILANDYLDAFYFLKKLRYAYEMLVRTETKNEEHGTDFLSYVKTQIQHNDFKHNDNAMFEIYILAIITKQKPTEENYYQLKEAIFDKIQNVPQESKEDVLIMLINTAFWTWGANDKCHKELFEVYKYGFLDTNYLIPSDGIQSTNFINFITIACVSKEFIVAKHFMSKNAMYLSADVKDYVLTLSEAYIFFYQKDFGTVLSLLKDIDFNNISIKYISKILQIKCSYELSEFEMMESLNNSFSVFLYRNNKLSDKRKTLNLNFTIFIKKLIKIVQLPNKGKEEIELRNKKIQDFIDDIKQATKLASKTWLLEKANNLLHN